MRRFATCSDVRSNRATGQILSSPIPSSRRAGCTKILRFRNVAAANDTEATLTGLTTGQTVKIRLTSVNDAGESLPSAEVQSVVP